MKIYEIYFSPTGGTKKVCDILAEGLKGERSAVDITEGVNGISGKDITKDDLAVIAVPSYGGRVPETAVKRIKELHGNGAMAVLLGVYGNRAYEDTLVELEDAVKESGFQVIAAVSAVAEHSIVRQIAEGRPNEADRKQLLSYAGHINEKISAGIRKEPEIPGNRPYKKYGKTEMVPKHTGDCVKCGLCAEKCPVQAIDKNDPKKVDSSACISCMRCVYVCPKNARKVNPVMLLAVKTALKKMCADRKECELFI